MKSLLLVLAVVLVGCGGGKREETQGPSSPEPTTPPQATGKQEPQPTLKAIAEKPMPPKTPKEPQTQQRSITLAQFLKGKRIHFQMDNGAGPFWAEFGTDGTHQHSDRPAGTYEVHGLKVAVQDFEKVELIFFSSKISAGDTFEAKAPGAKKGLHFKVLKVENIPGSTKLIVEKAIWDQLRADYREGMNALRDPGLSEEKRNDLHTQTEAIREKLKQPTGELTKADLEKVTKLNLSSKKLTRVPKGMEKFTKLTSLILHSNKLTNLKGLENLTHITGLTLESNQLTDVKGLENLTSLKELYLGVNKLTDVKGLEKLTHLTSLNLDDSRMTDVTGLERLSQLKELGLNGNQLTELPKGLEKLTQLEELGLEGNQLTDVKGLEKLTKLKWLYLEGNPDLTKAQIDQLKKALPKCEIVSDHD